MGRLIDADELKAVYVPSKIEGFEKMMVPVEVVLQNIDDMSTVDAVPVVRCKDCKFYYRMTAETGICELACRHLGNDGFCSEGERKGERQ